MAGPVPRRDIFRGFEGAKDDDGTEWITIIKEGTSINNRRYPRPVLQKAVDDRVYEHVRMFIDHSEGPPLKRSMRDLVSAITTTKLDTSFPDGLARVRGAVEWIDEEWHEKIDRAKEHIGVSHDALLRGTRSMKNGRRFEDINEIARANSVDWVIYPSAGGGFENSFLAQEGVNMPDAIDWDAIDEDMLKEHKPELYNALVARSQEGADDDDDEEDEDEDPEPTQASRAKESQSSKRKVKKIKLGPRLENEIQQIVMRSLESVQTKHEASKEALGKVEARVNKAPLPDVTKKRLIRSFEGVEAYDEKAVDQAIEDAKEEVAAIAKPRITGAGPSGAGSSKGSFGRAHEAVAAAFGRGLTSKKKVSTKSKKADDDDDEEEE